MEDDMGLENSLGDGMDFVKLTADGQIVDGEVKADLVGDERGMAVVFVRVGFVSHPLILLIELVIFLAYAVVFSNVCLF